MKWLARWTSDLKPRLHERFFACDGDAIFLKIVSSPARGENRMCNHSHTGDATDEKIAEKNREKFNELNFLRQNHGLRQRVATQAIFAARWQRDNFQKIASPSQAKNRSCSRGLKVGGSMSTPCHCVSLDKKLYPTLSLSTQVYRWVPLTYCSGGAWH